MKVLVTGAAGFIGSALCESLARKGETVIGIDNINSYYDPRLKHARLMNLGFDLPLTENEITVTPDSGFDRTPVTYRPVPPRKKLTSTKWRHLSFIRQSINDTCELEQLFKTERFDVVVNLAAQAGVRYSIENPRSYIENNISGFLNILECARLWPVKHLIYASSSSVYGGNENVPFRETDRIDNPVSLYAVTKKCDEMMANVYNHLYDIPVTGLRFFTVYGPWGRPDMAPMLFSEAIAHGEKIKVFNSGEMSRDFTYIDDIVNGIEKVIETPAPKTPCVLNIGCGHPTNLMDFISKLEGALGKKAEKEMYPMQPGDVPVTFADTEALKKVTGYRPTTLLDEGVRRFAEWYISWKKDNA